QKGTVDAVSTEEAIQRIKGQGYYHTSVREQQVKKDQAALAAGGPKKKKAASRSSVRARAQQMPAFTRLLSTLRHADLPVTRWLIHTSRWFGGTMPDQGVPGWAISLPMPLLLFILWKLVRKAGPGRAATDYLILYSPIFGPLVRKTVIARFTRTLGTLVSAG